MPSIDAKGIYDVAVQDETQCKSGNIDPRFIVMHYTAGWNDESAIQTLKNASVKASAHFVIGREGKVTQLVPCNTGAWHAGPSRWKGWTGLNKYSVGIEFVNIGFLKPVSDTHGIDPYGQTRELKALPLLGAAGMFVAAPHPRIGNGVYLWPTYTEAQLAAGDDLVAALIDRYKIQDILTHEQIDTRGWKTDPGPAFPMERYRAMIDEELDHWLTYRVTAKSLNVRGGPGTGFKATDALSENDTVIVTSDEGDWCQIRYGQNNHTTGWVHSAYIVAK